MTSQKLFNTISTFKKPENSPGFLLWKMSTRWRSQIERRLKDFELTHPQFVILATLAWLTENKDKVTQREVSQLSELDPNTTSQIMNNLEKKGLIKRLIALDPRAKNPTVTTKGKQVLTKAVPAIEEIDQEFFSYLSKKDLAQFMQNAIALISHYDEA